MCVCARSDFPSEAGKIIVVPFDRFIREIYGFCLLAESLRRVHSLKMIDRRFCAVWVTFCLLPSWLLEISDL